jgi:hypothetical protein
MNMKAVKRIDVDMGIGSQLRIHVHCLATNPELHRSDNPTLGVPQLRTELGGVRIRLKAHNEYPG